MRTNKISHFFSLLFISTLITFLTFAEAVEEERYQDYNVVVIQSLNKITARTSIIEINIDDTIELEKLLITPKTCKKTKQTEAPETLAFLEIDQLDHDHIFSKRIFSGWMFSSSPALSALEHPIIDIKVLDCLELIQSENIE